jgi:hypothetical protein
MPLAQEPHYFRFYHSPTKQNLLEVAINASNDIFKSWLRNEVESKAAGAGSYLTRQKIFVIKG